MKRRNFFKIAVPSVVASFIVAFSALAADELPGVDITIGGLGNLVTRFTCWVIQIILAIMVIALVAAGVRFFLVRGNPSNETKAKDNLKWVLAGIAVILGANIIISTIATFIYGADYPVIPTSNCSDIGSEDVNIPNSQP